MIESPLVQEWMAQNGHEYIVQVLETRFGAVPPEIVVALREILEDQRLQALHRLAILCPDLDAFRARLGS